MGHGKGKLMKTSPAEQPRTPRKKKCHRSQQETRFPQQYGKQAFCKSIHACFRSNTTLPLAQHKKCLTAYISVLVYTPINADMNYIHSRIHSLVFIVKLLFLEFNQAFRLHTYH